MHLVYERHRRIGGLFIWIGLVFLAFMAPMSFFGGDCFESETRCTQLWNLDRQRAVITMLLAVPLIVLAIAALRSHHPGRQVALLIASTSSLVAVIALRLVDSAGSFSMLSAVPIVGLPAIFLAMGSLLKVIAPRDIDER